MGSQNSILTPLAPSETLGEKAYFAVRKAIISGDLAAGEQVTERGLAGQLGISTTPIREALLRLEQHGLIERSREMGTTVSMVALSAVAETVLISAALHAVAARLAAEKITLGELDALREILAESKRVTQSTTSQTLLTLSDQFHDIVVKASRNVVLPKFLETVTAFGQEDRLKSLENKEEIPSGVAEHEAIIEALAAGDPDRAERLMRSHVLRAGKAMYGSLSDVSMAKEPDNP